MSKNDKAITKDSVSFLYLLTFFLKIGSISFGGFLALISVIQKEMVVKDKKIDDQCILDGITLASLLPGPLAVNTVCYIGYKLKGFWGAIVSMLAVIFPSFICLILLTYLYYEYGEIEVVKQVLAVVMPAIIAIVLTVGLNMTKKHVTNWKQYVIVILSVVLLQFVGGVLTTIALILFGGLIGVILFKEEGDVEKITKPLFQFKLFTRLFKNLFIISICFTIILFCTFLWDPTGAIFKLNTTIFGVFSGMSLTLFGGGYVVIPIIQELIVKNLEWLSLEEFNTAIALSQVTPGPILVSSTFIGYKIGGIFGAFVATISIFFPSGILMIFLSHFIDQLKNTPWVIAAFKGVRPVVIGLIFSASITIGLSTITGWIIFILFLIFTVLMMRFNLSSVQIILLGLVLGIISIFI